MQSAAHIADHQIPIESAEPEVYGPGRAYVDLIIPSPRGFAWVRKTPFTLVTLTKLSGI